MLFFIVIKIKEKKRCLVLSLGLTLEAMSFSSAHRQEVEYALSVLNRRNRRERCQQALRVILCTRFLTNFYEASYTLYEF